MATVMGGAMLPPLLLTFNARPTQLYSSKCVRVTMDERTSRVTITAHSGNDGDASCAISGIIQATDVLLGRGQQYSVVWDLRDSPTPGVRDTMRLAAWGVSRKANLERLTTKMGIVMREGAVASVVGSLLGAFSGVPTVMAADLDEVEAQM
jgi:hypothetical protein